MPRFIVFLVSTKKSPPTGDGENPAKSLKETGEEVREAAEESPVVNQILKDTAEWSIGPGVSSLHCVGSISDIEGGARLDFHGTRINPNKKDLDDNEPRFVEPDISITKDLKDAWSATLSMFFVVEYPSLEEVIDWARKLPSCNSSTSIEIRQLEDAAEAFEEAPADMKTKAKDEVASNRQRMLEQGKARQDSDGTYWIKVEEDKIPKSLQFKNEKKEQD